MAVRAGRGRLVYRGLHVKVYFDMDRAGIRHIAVGPELQALTLEIVARKALPYAVSISPRSQRRVDDEHHRHYQDSFIVQPVRTGLSPEAIGRPPMRRAGARLANIARHAAVIEFGKQGQRAHHVLRRTLEHLSAGAS